MRKFHLILATVLSFVLLNEVGIRPQSGNLAEWLTQETSVAYARSSGGRSRGGSFSKPSRSSGSRSSGSRSSSGSSKPSRSSGSSSGSRSSSGSSSPSRSSSGSSSSPSRSNSSSGSSSGSSIQDSVRPSSSPATTNTNPSSNTSRGQTGGRARGGSFDKPTVAPVPVIPNSSNSGSPFPEVPVSPSTGTTYVPVAPNSHHSRPSSFELEIENNTIIVPPSPPVRQPYIAPVPIYLDNPENTIENSELNTQPVTAPSSTLQPVPVNASPNVEPTVVPNSATVATSNSSQSKGFPWGWVLFFLVIGGGVAIAWYVLAKKNSTAGTANELDNDVVTVTKLQIALLANARDLQSYLTDLSYNAELETPEGRVEFLQETALALLRQPEYWSHALSSSQTVKSREAAGQVFEQLSIAERSKFSAETFSNVQGQVRERQGMGGDDDNDPAAYIVVTLLIGTEDDQPLFGQIHSTEELQQGLQRVAAITADYLLVVELLWSPQEATDSLSYDQLLTGYPDMVQV